jgi:hypothetical protein
MAQTIVCGNHPEDPTPAVLMLTQVDTGEVMSLCAACWPLTFAGMLDALPAEERPSRPGAEAEAPPNGTAASTPAAPESGADNVAVLPARRSTRRKAGKAT